jgi:hypothetical protein
MIELVADATERMTAATDGLLALLCLACLLHLRPFRDRDAWKVGVWCGAFAFLGIASALGAIAHGLVLGRATSALLWGPLYLCLGLAVALFGTGAMHDLAGRHASRRALPALVIVALAFFAITRLIDGGFVVFILYEAVVMLAALAAYIRLAATPRLPGAPLMATGILLSLLAALLQATRLLPPFWSLDHNGQFHLVQMAALFALAAGLGKALRESLPLAAKCVRS